MTDALNLAPSHPFATYLMLRVPFKQWGIRVSYAVEIGDLVEARNMKGEVSTVEVTRIVWTNGERALCTFRSSTKRSAPPSSLAIVAPAPVAASAPIAVAAAPATSIPATAAPAAPTIKPLSTCARIDAAFSQDSFVAISCACCGRPLTDPDSIEIGLGPICRRDHGFDIADESAAWAACFTVLGSSYPVDTYDAIVERYGHFVHANPDDQARDVKRAVKILIHRIAVADQAKTDGTILLRTVLAIEALGYKRLALVLGRALVRRPSLRELRNAASVYAVVQRDANTLYIQSTLSDWRVTSSLRRNGIPFKSIRGGWTLDAHHLETLRGIVAMDLSYVDLVIFPDSIKVSRDLRDVTPVYESWLDADGGGERTEWLDVKTGKWVRTAIAGEPASRPGWEKVPALYFAKTIPVAD